MKISVIGAAKSGLAAAKLALRLGEKVFLSEFKDDSGFIETKNELVKLNIPYEFGGHSDKAFDCELMIVSPGVSKKSPIIQKAEALGIEIISELEYAYRNAKNPIIAITGTNGKTTTTSLIAYALNRAGKKAYACGNIGEPMSNLVLDSEDDAIFVAEVSSYQLEYCSTFKPNVSIILNITPDHLAFHSTFENYCKAKYKIFTNQIGKDFVFLNQDDAPTLAGGKLVKAQTAYFSINEVERGICLKDNSITFINLDNEHKEEILMGVAQLSLPGLHNVYNSMASALALKSFGVSSDSIRGSLETFSGVEHRLEFVRDLDGVRFINDSKATNINAAWYALISYNKPLVWIAGGRGDSNNYSELDEPVANNVKCIIAIGEEAEAIYKHFAPKKRVEIANSMEEALEIAQRMAVSGDIILFSPACKSFDWYQNYEQRGEAFKAEVNKL